MKKIRVTIPKYMEDILKYDAVEFGITKNYLLNYLTRNSKIFMTNEKVVFEGKKEVVQFSLNKENLNLYEDLYKESEFQTEASFIRALIYSYISKSKVLRERLLFRDIIKKINIGIQRRKKIKIKFQDNEKIVTPYDVLYSSMEVSNYLFCYCGADQEYKNHRICNIKYIYVLGEDGFLGDKRYIEEVKENFDPFLSYGKKVILKLSEKGKLKYERIKTNRPKLLEKKGGILIVEGSDEKIKRYFSYFMSEIEILKPLSLRNWYLEESQKMAENYKTKQK